MNILSISGAQFRTPFSKNEQVSSNINNRYGLTMAKPLLNDTVSFSFKGKSSAAKKVVTEALEQTSKEAGAFENSARIRDIKDKIEPLVQAHKDMKKAILKIYRGHIAERNRTKDCSLTLLDRIKKTGSAKEKTTTVNVNDLEDLSGFAFVIEDKKGFKIFTDSFSELIKNGYTVVDYEYHRIAPKYHRGQLEKTYNSLNPSTQQRLKSEILKLNPQMDDHMLERDSKGGYSAIHMILKDKKGNKHEIQVYTRAIADVKGAENLVFKLKNGKRIPEIFLKVSPHLKLLQKPKNGTKLSPEAQVIQTEMKGYTWDAYEDALTHPYTPNKILKSDLKKYPHLKDYDLNILALLLELPH